MVCSGTTLYCVCPLYLFLVSTHVCVPAFEGDACCAEQIGAAWISDAYGDTCRIRGQTC